MTSQESRKRALARIKQINNEIQEREKRGPDNKLAEELQEKREQAEAKLESVPERFFESNEPGADTGASDFTLETIVLRTGRPVLEVLNDEAKLEFRDTESEVWRSRLSAAKSQLVHAVRAVGRIELENNPRFKWVGTGWLVAPTIIVTNRHVANEFALKRNGSFVFRSGVGGQMQASVDFLEEFGREDSLAFKLKSILHIEPDSGPDMAFLEVEPSSNKSALADPIRLATGTPEAERFVATIGYPAKDSRIPDLALMLEIFGEVFDKKRLAPGQIQRATAQQVQHDCSTLGGNSGSVVLDLATGEALALHFAGRFLEANFAVPAPVVAARVAQLRTGVVPVSTPGPSPTPKPGASPQGPQPATPQVSAHSPQQQTEDVSVSMSGTVPTLTCTIPVTFTIQVGSPIPGGAATISSIKAASRPDDDDDEPNELFAPEAPPESFTNRGGFQPDFLGASHRVQLPKIGGPAARIVTFDVNGSKQSELKYQHFSVKMNRDRRMCFFSACNVDGKQSKQTVRGGWKFDSRIPQNLQIMKECYGNPPKFSRGHMTRREDPAWGSRAESNLGNDDSMHVTNTVPQMQTFNGGIWLSLEEFALQNAREDDMRISVITGPFFRNNDPVQFGIKIPRSFWKVIAFIHDESGKLTATGYSISQDPFLNENEFVFGQFGTSQRSLASIEKEADISFGSLSEHDPLAQDHEAVPAALTSLDQIRFV